MEVAAVVCASAVDLDIVLLPLLPRPPPLTCLLDPRHWQPGGVQEAHLHQHTSLIPVDALRLEL